MTKSKQSSIPELPGDNASPEELSTYYEQYSPQELIEAGHMQVLPKDDPRVLNRNAAAKQIRDKRKRPQLNILFNEEELSELAAYADAIHIRPSTIARSWILRALKAEKGKLSETSL